ncbi:hypothetical protein A6R68_17319, partial [Neotoma lepida]
MNCKVDGMSHFKMIVWISKKRRSVAYDIFKDELNEFLTQELRVGFPEGSGKLYVEKVAIRVTNLQMPLSCEGTANIGPKKPLPDCVSTVEPRDEILPTTRFQSKRMESQRGLLTYCFHFCVFTDDHQQDSQKAIDGIGQQAPYPIMRRPTPNTRDSEEPGRTLPLIA